METKMKRTRSSFAPALIPVLVALTQVFCACAGQGGSRAVAGNAAGFAAMPALAERNAGALTPSDVERISGLLEELAELERSGIYRPEMGMAESGLKEKLGDYAGAVVAAYKEMSWLYGHGFLEMEAVVQGLDRVMAIDDLEAYEGASQTAHALLAFTQGRWDDAERQLVALFGDTDEPDGFVRWMLLSCALEKDPSDRKAGTAYRAIRARYVLFPEYWYRGAKVFSGTIASEFAETCINLAPEGPFAEECRGLLASLSGLREEDGPAIRSKNEIEGLISQAVSKGNPQLLAQLIPLITLAENPYTVYAIGALKALASNPHFKGYFDGLAVSSSGRLADRLAYICRG